MANLVKTAAEINNFLVGNPDNTTKEALRNNLGIAQIESHIASTTNPHSVTKAQVGLSNVDNTSDANKPISTAQAAVNAAKADLVGGRVPSEQLPAYVGDVLEYDNLAAFPALGEAGKIYVARDTNLTYRWSGSAYVEIGKSLALGETSATAYRGDRGKIAYDHSQIISGNPHNISPGDIGLEKIDNTSDLEKPVSTLQQEALDLKVDKISGKGLSTEDYTTTEKTKLAGIENEANKYIHPVNHPASIIVQDSNNRFVTDTEKTKLSNLSGTNTGDQDLTPYLKKDGSINLNSDYIPSSDNSIVNKKYVDDSIVSSGGYTDDQAKDAVGNMVTENTETGITVTYDNTNKKLNFNVSVQTDNNFTNTYKSKLDSIEANANNYSLPIASETTLGGVKIGERLTITDGVLSANEQSGTVNSVNTQTGVVVLDADDIDDSGTTNKFVTSTDINNWNAKSNFSGSYNDLSDTPTIPTDVSDLTDTTGIIPSNTSDLTNDSNFVSDISYVHTDNNFTNDLETKLNGIEAGAEVNVNADWNAISGDAQILNKPTIPSQTSDLTNDSNFVSDSSYIHTDNNYTTTEKNKLSEIETGATAGANWNTNLTNKPLIPSLLSDLSDDSDHRLTTDTEKSNWNNKASLTSPAFSGTPTAPTQVSTDNSTKLATTAFVKLIIQELINNSPESLNTLDELAAALGDDPNFATTISTLISQKLAKASNLSDLTDVSVARTNLGLGAIALLGAIAMSDVTGLVSALAAKASSTDLTSHTGNTSNPHTVTKAQVGLENVDNTSDADKPISIAQGSALAVLFKAISYNETTGVLTLTKRDDSTVTVTIPAIATVNSKAPLESPALTGTPTAPTAPVATDNTQLATTGFVKAVLAAAGYITGITKAMVEAVLTGTITSHNHAGTYEPANANIQNHIASTHQRIITNNDVALPAATDWNNYSTTGFYMGSGLTNSPSVSGANEWWWVTVIRHNNLWCTQMATDFNNTATCIRNMVNGAWGNWRRLEDFFTKNTAFNKNFGTAAGTVCQGNDARLSDTRTPSDTSVTYAKVANDLKNRITDNDGAWDFSAAGIIEATVSANVTVSFTNLQQNKTLKVKLVISGGATVSLPAYCKVLEGSAELGDGTFYVYFDCWNAGSGTELVLTSIVKEAA